MKQGPAGPLDSARLRWSSESMLSYSVICEYAQQHTAYLAVIASRRIANGVFPELHLCNACLGSPQTQLLVATEAARQAIIFDVSFFRIRNCIFQWH